MKTYTCDSCHKEQTHAIQAQEAENYYDYTLATGDSDLHETICGDHIAWYCPECEEELSPALSKAIQDSLWG